jgi:hypothetical protein
MYELEGGVTAAYFVVRAIAEDGGGIIAKCEKW